MKNLKISSLFVCFKRANTILPVLAMGFALLLVSSAPAAEASSQQQPSVKGTITDMYTGNAIAGVSVTVMDSDAGVESQQDGSYNIALPPGAKVLVYSVEGYQTLEVDIDGRTEIEISMSQSNSAKESNLWR